MRLLSRHNAPVHTVSVSPDGKQAASAGEDGAIILWDLGSGKVIKKMTGHTAMIHTLAFDSEGSTVISGGADYTVRLWNAKAPVSEALADGAR